VLCTSDPLAIDHVLKKWRDFVKPDNVNGEYDQKGDVAFAGSDSESQRSWVLSVRMSIRYVFRTLESPGAFFYDRFM